MKKTEFVQIKLLFQYLSNYFLFIGDLIRSVQTLTHEALEKTTTGLNELGISSMDNRKKAERVLIQTYLNPKKKEMDKIQASQDSVDKILDQLHKGDTDATIADDHAAAKSRVGGGMFSKRIEAVSFLEEKVTSILLDLMGQLSSDDVIVQQINNAILATKLSQKFLGYFLQYQEPIITNETVRIQQNELLGELFQHYKSQKEKTIYRDNRLEDESILNGGSEMLSYSKLNEIITFLKRYNLTLADQLGDIEVIIIETIQVAINGIMNLDQSATKYKDHGRSKMLKKDGDNFQNVIVAEDEERQDETITKVKLHFSTKMLDQLSTQISQDMIGMMGILSIGDVASQRIKTAVKVSKLLVEFLDEVAGDLTGLLNENRLDPIKKKYLIKTNELFVTEDDKRLFKKVFVEFGAMMDDQKAS